MRLPCNELKLHSSAGRKAVPACYGGMLADKIWKLFSLGFFLPPSLFVFSPVLCDKKVKRQEL